MKKRIAMLWGLIFLLVVTSGVPSYGKEIPLSDTQNTIDEKENESKDDSEKVDNDKKKDAEAEEKKENIKQMDKKVSKQAEGTFDERLAFIMEQFPPSETYFTQDGKPCSGHNNCRTFDKGKQCLGFARYVFHNLYDTVLPPTSSDTYEKILNVRKLRPGSISAESAKKLFQNSKTGDVFQAATIGRSSGVASNHTMIVLEADEKGVQVLDANFDNKCGVSQHFITYEYISEWCTSILLGTYNDGMKNENTEKEIENENNGGGEGEDDEIDTDVEQIDVTKLFKDVSNHWAKNEIQFVVENQLFSGVTETEFMPDKPVTRGMFVTALGRFSGVDVNEYTSVRFKDVKNTSYYAPYVDWAEKSGIANGMTETTFMPDSNISREQMAVMICKYAQINGISLNQSEEKEIIFLDEKKIHDWALSSVKLVQKSGIIGGREVLEYKNGVGHVVGYNFAPGSVATRAEVAIVLKRFTDVANQ